MKRRDFLRSSFITGGVSALPQFALARVSAPPRNNSDAAEAVTSKCESYTRQDRVRSGMALGGIGAGCVELRKNGRFYNWSIFNNYPKEPGPVFALPDHDVEDRMSSVLFFEVRYQLPGSLPKIKLLQLSDSLFEGAIMGAAYFFPWMTSIARIEYDAVFPVATLRFSDGEMPFDLEMQAWSPFIPHDVKNSSLPLIFFDMTVRAKTEEPIEVTLLMSARNCSGYDTETRSYTTSIAIEPRKTAVTMGCGSMDPKASSWGEITIASFSQASSFYAGWGFLHPYYEQVLRNAVLPNLDDTNGADSMAGKAPSWLPSGSGRNAKNKNTGKLQIRDADVYSTVAHTFRLQGADVRIKHRFVYAWNFPNLYNGPEYDVMGDRIEGHFYSNFFASAFEVVAYAQERGDELKERTLGFQSDFFASDAPRPLLDQVNSQLNTFLTSGRLVKDGSFGVLEGLTRSHSWGPIGTIDVMYYASIAVLTLFPELQKSTLRCHARVQEVTGELNHGLMKDFRVGEDASSGVTHRIDLPGQFITMALRDAFWTEDHEYLREMWPHVLRAADYVLNIRGDKDGFVLLTKNVETSFDNFPMFGYSTYLLSQWVCAASSVVEAAHLLGDTEVMARFTAIAERTRERMEKTLWNGSFYRLYFDPTGEHHESSEACFTDQIIGQWAAYTCALEDIAPKENRLSALKTILERNTRPGVGLINASQSMERTLPAIPVATEVDQANTAWTGVELEFASLLMYEGLYEDAVRVVRDVNDRYRSNGLYWNHQEYGGHYFRPMSAWSLVNGVLGFGLRNGMMTFDPKMPRQQVRLFFATPTGTAHFERTQAGTVRLHCLTGELRIRAIRMRELRTRVAIHDHPVLGEVSSMDGWHLLRFAVQQSVTAGSFMEIS